MTLVDSADLAERACPVCGAVVGDMLRHRRWHVEDEERVEATVAVLRDLVADAVDRHTDPS